MSTPIPDVWANLAATEMSSDFETLNDQDQQIVNELYTSIVSKDDMFMYMLQSEIHSKWLQYSHKNKNHNHLDTSTDNNNNDINNQNSSISDTNSDLIQWQKFVNNLEYEKWNVTNEIHTYNRKGPKNLGALTDPSHEWFPGENELWMEQFIRMVTGIDTNEHTQNLINRIKKTKVLQMSPSNGTWVPPNPWHLYKMYQPFCTLNSVRVIRCKVLQKTNKNVSEYCERIYTYDSFINDWTSYLQNDIHRNALLGSVQDFLKIHKNNPIHIKHNPDGNAKIHSTSWRLSRFGLEKKLFS